MPPLHPNPYLRLLLLALPGLLCASCIGLPSAADAGEGLMVRQLLVRKHAFTAVRAPVSTSEDGFAVYWSAISFRTDITVYGVLDHGEQDQIVSILDAIRRERHLKPISVTFYSNRDQQETVYSDHDKHGTVSGPPDDPIRTVMIRDPRPYDIKPSDLWF
jgi:hypothetical protein